MKFPVVCGKTDNSTLIFSNNTKVNVQERRLGKSHRKHSSFMNCAKFCTADELHKRLTRFRERAKCYGVRKLCEFIICVKQTYIPISSYVFLELHNFNFRLVHLYILGKQFSKALWRKLNHYRMRIVGYCNKSSSESSAFSRHKTQRF